MSPRLRLLLFLLFIGLGILTLVVDQGDTAGQMLGQVQQNLEEQLHTIDIRTPVAGEVTSITDGDTIAVYHGDKVEKIRILGIDTPELARAGNPVECFAEQSKEKVAQLVAGKAVELVGDLSQGDRDRYGRLLRYVLLDGQDIGLTLLKEGYAHEYTYNRPYQYKSEYVQAEQEAKKNNLGLWNTSNCPAQ